MQTMTNKLEAVGKVLSISVEEKTNTFQWKGEEITVVNMEGELTLRLEMNGEVHEPKFSIKVSDKAKAFKALQTVRDEYKTIEVDGEELADRVLLTGVLGKQEYYSKKNSRIAYYDDFVFKSVTRKIPEGMEDKCELLLEGLIRSVKPRMDKEGLPTGEMVVDMINVPWVYGDKTPKLIQPRELVVSAEMSEGLKACVFADTVWRFTCKYNRGVTVEEQSAGVGFGNFKKVPKKSYKTSIEIEGGEPTKDLKESEIEEIVKTRRLQRDSIGNGGAKAEPKPKKGFEAPPKQQEALTINDDGGLPF